jgi:hypothetical protein
MGGLSEREYKEKLNKILENANKGTKSVREKFAEIEEIRVDALKKVEEIKRSADQDLDKVLIDITKSRDLVTESKDRLQTEIIKVRGKIEEKYNYLRNRISETIVPKIKEPELEFQS